MYWMGLDAAMLQRYGAVFDWWMGKLDGPIPYDRLNPKRDFYQVFLEFNPKQESWKVVGARGVTTKDSRNQNQLNILRFYLEAGSWNRNTGDRKK